MKRCRYCNRAYKQSSSGIWKGKQFANHKASCPQRIENARLSVGKALKELSHNVANP